MNIVKVGENRGEIDSVFQTTPGICPDESPESGRISYPADGISTGRWVDCGMKRASWQAGRSGGGDLNL